MSGIEGQLAIVSGTECELAVGLAEALLMAGARLAVTGTSRDVAEALAGQLRSASGEVTFYQSEFSAAGTDRTLTAIIRAQGRPAILVTCPTAPVVCPSAELPEAHVRQQLEANVVHAFLWCQAVGREMLAAGDGVIVNVSGLWGLGGWPNWLAGGMALAAVANLTHTLAAEWTSRGVRVNCLVPGVTEKTRNLLQQTPQGADAARILQRIPLGRLATARDLGEALLYLVHPDAGYISGEVLTVDGGWDVWGRYYAVDPHRR